MELGNTIREIRTKKGITQKDLAERSGLSANALCNIEKGYTFPPKETIKAICDALEIPVSLLLFSCITEDDIPSGKKEVFYALREPILKIFGI